MENKREDAIDLKVYEKAKDAFRENPETFTLGEVEKILGVNAMDIDVAE